MNCYCSYTSFQFPENMLFHFSQCPTWLRFARIFIGKNANEIMHARLSELRAAVAATLTSFDVQSIAVSATNLDYLAQNLCVSPAFIFLFRL